MPYYPVRKKIVRRPANDQAPPLGQLPELLQRLYASREIRDTG